LKLLLEFGASFDFQAVFVTFFYEVSDLFNLIFSEDFLWEFFQ
jgi:hypothetical protein